MTFSTTCGRRRERLRSNLAHMTCVYSTNLKFILPGENL